MNWRSVRDPAKNFDCLVLSPFGGFLTGNGWSNLQRQVSEPGNGLLLVLRFPVHDREPKSDDPRTGNYRYHILSTAIVSVLEPCSSGS